MAGQNQIIGGGFQDFEGNILANGYLTMQLSHDEGQSVGPGQVVAGYPLQVPLDANGNIAGTVLVWPNDQLNPVNSYYIVNAYRRDGIQAWRSAQVETVTSSPSPFNVGVWVPGLPIPLASPGAPLGSLLLQTNGINNGSQTKLNLLGSVTDDGHGDITVGGAGGGHFGTFTDWHGYSGSSQQGAGINVQNQYGVGFTGLAGNSSSLGFIAPTATELGGVDVRMLSSDFSQGCFNDINPSITLGILKTYLERLQINNTTTVRYWLGMSDVGGNSNNQLNTNAFNFNFVGFRYSAGTDTNWVAITQTNTAPGLPNQTITNTGVAPSTVASHEFEIVPSGGSVTFYIDGVLVATNSTNVPASNKPMGGIHEVDRNGGSTTVSMTLQYLYWLSTRT